MDYRHREIKQLKSEYEKLKKLRGMPMTKELLESKLHELNLDIKFFPGDPPLR